MKKPYAFVPLPDAFTSAPPVWHDGTCSLNRKSGEIRFEMTNLSPLLVGWERQTVAEMKPADGWPVRDDLDEFRNQAGEDAVKNAGKIVYLPNVEFTSESKPVLCSLRAPLDPQPVIIIGDSLKGLLRQELGALLGAPMERVAERSYSYRPNSLFPNRPGSKLEPRLARVPNNPIYAYVDLLGVRVRVPTELEVLPAGLEYQGDYWFNGPGVRNYRGGLGGGEQLTSKKTLHDRVEVNFIGAPTLLPIAAEAQNGYVNTISQLADPKHGHFTDRHPGIGDPPGKVKGDHARARILEVASTLAFSPGDYVWIELDVTNPIITNQKIVSLGWHYYYRWAYQDTVRKEGWTTERRGLSPQPEEKHDQPEGLSAVRRLFGYALDKDNNGTHGIGKDNYSQLMGRISINSALEQVADGESPETRFLKPTFLKELGMPRPSAVEFYLKQPYYPNKRPWDQATLMTYGDAVGYGTPGKLAGRKFYLDRESAAENDDAANRLNIRSTLAVGASRPNRTFRFTLRFRDLDPRELAAALLALCPNQFAGKMGGTHVDGYCSKLGYARPLGWGTVRIQAKELYFLGANEDGTAKLEPEDLATWFSKNRPADFPVLNKWLEVHRHNNPDAGDYVPMTENTRLRAEHSRKRRYT